MGKVDEKSKFGNYLVFINFNFSSPKRIKLVLTLQVDDGDGRLNYKEFEKMVQIAQKSQKNIED